jgi:hypothetical protein
MDFLQPRIERQELAVHVPSIQGFHTERLGPVSRYELALVPVEEVVEEASTSS